MILSADAWHAIESGFNEWLANESGLDLNEHPWVCITTHEIHIDGQMSFEGVCKLADLIREHGEK